MGLHPLGAPFNTFFLERGNGVSLYVEESGAKDGTPVLALHGGPGSGMGDARRRLFDPERYRLIQIDQRGAGKSRPHAQLDGNTTQALIADNEALRAHLGIDRWAVFGGSWGSTLGLAYAQAHPEAVTHLVLTGIYLGTPEEAAWWYAPDGAQRFHPRAYAEFIDPVPEKLRANWRDVIAWYLDAMREENASGAYDALPFDQPRKRVEASKASRIVGWTVYEQVLSNFSRTREEARAKILALTPNYIRAHSLIEAWYFQHDCFLAPGQLLRDMPKIAEIPLHILQGRLDMVCPPASAHAVYEAHPQVDIRYSARHGHIPRMDMQRMIKETFDGL